MTARRPKIPWNPCGDRCIMLRVNDKMYKTIERRAEKLGISLNQFVSASMADYLGLTPA